jgi:signal transduction histidine kinase
MQRAIFFLACILSYVTGKTQQYPFVHYTPREGLVNNRARSVFQDSKGKLYIATFGGLSIYDGTRFINYDTHNGLNFDMINQVVEMGEDSLWIIPNANHLNCLVNGRMKNFITDDKFIPLINQLLKASNGYYYAMADEGLFRLENRKFIKIPIEGLPAGVPARTFLRAEEFNKKLFILSNPDYKLAGPNLLVYDLSQNKLLAYKSNIRVGFLFRASVNDLLISAMEKMYIVDNTALANNRVELKELPDSFHIPKNIFPNYMYRDRQNNFWICSPLGLYKIKKDGETTFFTVENGLTTNEQTSIFQDHENNMWFTNLQTGLCKLSNNQVAYYPALRAGDIITDIFINSSSDTVWLYDGHHRGLISLPRGRTEDYQNHLIKTPVSDYSKFVSGNSKWLITGNYIFEWNAALNKIQPGQPPIYIDPDTTTAFSDAITDRFGNLVAVSNKLVVVAGSKILMEPLHYMTDHVTVDRENRVWVATRSDQLYCFEISGSGSNTKLSLLQVYDHPIPGSPRSITADQSGNIWIGTRDKGLYCIYFDSLKIRSFRQLTSQDGLSESFISYLFCDKENNIWAATPSGLDKIKMVNNQFLIENITRSMNLYQPIGKIQQTKKGFFWILTSAGIITYDPSRPPVNDWKPFLGFSETVISNAGREAMPDNRELSYFKNNISFQLSAPTYIDEKQTRFSYLLEGSGNKNWSVPSTDASINFVNLPHGEYTLRARAIFLHGLYPNAESVYTFTILPPWWQTWRFKLLTGIFLLGLILLGLRYYINRRLQLERMTLEKRRAIEKERTRIATDMHDDLGAGLSQIKFLSEAIGMKKQQHLPIEEEINSIRNCSDEMIDKMGEIVWALNEKNDTLSDLLSYTRAYAVEYLEQNGITCRVKQPDNLVQLYVSSEFRRNIYLTVKEALHNIVKHAQATEVLIIVDVADSLNIQIRDNGKGINITKARSSGNGLINMNTRIQGIKGLFEIVNNNGTVINIMVPLGL